jgi:Kef-type K+ transport system membrane component KefB
MAEAIGRPLYVLFGSLLLAICLANLGILAFRLLGKRREGQLVGALGLVMLAAGLATIWNLSPALVLLALGASLRILDREQRMMALDFGRTGQLFYLLLFALIGASLDLRAAAGAAAAAVLFVTVRAAAKTFTVIAFAHATRQPLHKAALLALALQPMSALAVVMAYQASLAQAQLAASVVPIVWASVLVFQLAGPLCVQVALRWSGEADPEVA